MVLTCQIVVGHLGAKQLAASAIGVTVSLGAPINTCTMDIRGSTEIRGPSDISQDGMCRIKEI